MMRLADLREILRYVPQYREKIFVIALDGLIVEDEHFRTLLLDVALLRSLRIGVVIVHGAGHQVKRLAEQTGKTISNVDGTGITDFPTLQLAITAANRVSHEILEGLSANDLRGACGNVLVAHPAGILMGIDHQYTGRVERVDVTLLRSLLEKDIIPVVPPLGCDGEGNTYRLNSDAVAVEVANALQAVKLIYLSTLPGVLVKKPEKAEAELIRHLTVDEAEAILKRFKPEMEMLPYSKLSNAVRALRGKVPRVHIIDGRVDEGLLGEVFSNDGIGTLVHTNEYQAIRKAQKKDARAIFALIKSSVESQELAPRTLSEIERQMPDYHVFEVDGNIAGCIALHPYPDVNKAEMACVCVSSKYENQGIGARLMNFVEDQARITGYREIFCLSTQAVNYFVQKGGYRLATPDDLPPTRRQKYDLSGRRSKVLVKKIS